MHPHRLFRWAILTLLFVLPALSRGQEPKVEYPPAEEVRAAFLKMLDRPNVLFNVKVEETKKDEDDDSIAIERLSFASEKRADGEAEVFDDGERREEQSAHEL